MSSVRMLKEAQRLVGVCLVYGSIVLRGSVAERGFSSTDVVRYAHKRDTTQEGPCKRARKHVWCKQEPRDMHTTSRVGEHEQAIATAFSFVGRWEVLGDPIQCIANVF